MNRKEFLKTLSILGVSAPFANILLSACSKDADFYPEFDVNFNGKVIVVGAGAAGITAGYVLNRYGIDFEIIEASAVYGGRVKKIDDFADFPIDLGAEWIHTEPSILARLRNDQTTGGNVELIKYSPENIKLWKNNNLKSRKIFSNFYSEYKFKNTTWFDFFETYMIPDIADKIRLNTPVTSINYSSDKVVVSTENGLSMEADKVLVTVPLKILQSDLISFTPALSQEKVDAINSVEMPDGLKVFIEFTEKFYPDLLFIGGISSVFEGSFIYYNAAYGKDSNRHILGLFAVDTPSSTYANLPTDQDTIDAIMSELDTIFNGRASETYVKHVIQNWTKEPYIQGSYSHYENYAPMAIIREPLNNKVYFSGEHVAESDSTAHGAAESSYRVVEEMLKG